MDKVQKQLLDTYVRKRIIANDFDSNNNLEVIYLLKHNYKIRLNYYTGANVMNLLRVHPEFLGKLDSIDVEKLNIDHIEGLLYEQPKEFVDNFLKNIDYKKLSSQFIRDILVRHPEVINYVNPDKISGVNISTILMYQPDLISYFDLSKLPHFSIMNLLVIQPQLKDYFS